MSGFTNGVRFDFICAMKWTVSNQKFWHVAAVLAGVALAGAAGAVTPMTGPEFDKMMVLTEQGEGPGISVGQFAGCAEEQIQTLVAEGNRDPSNSNVTGILDGDIFLVTVPGVSTDIVFQFVTLENQPSALYLDRIVIGPVSSTAYGDKASAIGALIPDCL